MDSKVTGLTELAATPASTDVALIIDDPGGTPISKKITVANLLGDATLNADTDVSSNGWVVDEDDMSSDLATKVPSQQSVKAYVDTRPEIIFFKVIADGVDCSTGDGKFFLPPMPAAYSGWEITAVEFASSVAGTTGTMDVQLRNVTQAADVLSTIATIDSTETSTSTAATPLVIDTAEDDITTGDVYAIDVDAVQTTPATGLGGYIEITKP